MEEQRELSALERDVRVRKVRVGISLMAALGVVIGVACLAGSQPSPAHVECKVTRLEHEAFVYPGGRMQRPADTWTTCDLR